MLAEDSGNSQRSLESISCKTSSGWRGPGRPIGGGVVRVSKSSKMVLPSRGVKTGGWILCVEVSDCVGSETDLEVELVTDVDDDVGTSDAGPDGITGLKVLGGITGGLGLLVVGIAGLVVSGRKTSTLDSVEVVVVVFLSSTAGA